MDKAIYSETHKNLVSKLKTARLKTNLKQEEAAKLLGKTQSYISKVESGQRKIDLFEISNFARIYKKEVSYFISKK